MRIEEELKRLNKEQLEAVKNIDGALLILASAGSGKTKTITTRLAYLISLGVDPLSTLTLTFTNKAAKEMRERALNIIGQSTYNPYLATFHQFGVLFLRKHIDVLDRKNDFTIVDGPDKKKILKDIDKNMAADKVEYAISTYKNSMLDISSVVTPKTENEKRFLDIYDKYSKHMAKNNLLDFDDLLLLPYLILRDNKELRDLVSSKYSYIMVDEYQDTNELQYELLKLLSEKHKNLCVVGDDDQSIYGWRGARIENILNFNKQFDNAKIIKLTKNYRSSEEIINIANKLISNNRDRLGKYIEATCGNHDEVKYKEFYDEKEESDFISRKIKELLATDKSREVAILYRLNSLSRAIEESLSKHNINYKLVGGMRFYERAEIKDILCYLRLMVNRNDDFSLSRVINKPRRGIGNVTFEKIKNSSDLKNLSIYEFISSNKEESLELLGKKNYEKISDFFRMIDYLSSLFEGDKEEFLETFESRVKLKEFYLSQADGSDKIRNIDEFYASFKERFSDTSLALSDYLSEITLESDQDKLETAERSSVYCMSIHTSKGLEFDTVFIIGLENGIFPMFKEDSDEEEERRLGYVATTRAKRKLFLSSAKSRFYRGVRSRFDSSKFLFEMGFSAKKESAEERRTFYPKRKSSFDDYSSNEAEFKKGDAVKHPVFGYGKVEAVGKMANQYKLTINFGGSKKDILSSFIKKIS